MKNLVGYRKKTFRNKTQPTLPLHFRANEIINDVMFFAFQLLLFVACNTFTSDNVQTCFCTICTQVCVQHVVKWTHTHTHTLSQKHTYTHTQTHTQIKRDRETLERGEGYFNYNFTLKLLLF